MSEEEVFLSQSPGEPDASHEVSLVLGLLDGIVALPRIIKTIEVRYTQEKGTNDITSNPIY